MKLLVSTHNTQGLRASDFCFVPDGEFVLPSMFVCDDDLDGSCGCNRGMVGAYCHKGTTTVKVVNSSMSKTEFGVMVANSVHLRTKVNNTEAHKIAQRMVDGILEAIKPFKVGTILEYRAGELIPR